MIFGTDSLLNGKIIFVDALIIALPLSIITVIIVSLLTKPMENIHLNKCFKD